MKLSIAIITMNRQEQIKEAIESCFQCSLPAETEFVIVDNASSDNTEVVVRTLFDGCRYSLVYKKNSENIGAGGGRNLAYTLCSGQYIYAMDDDAYIPGTNNDFFIRAIEFLDLYHDIAALATQIYDNAWKDNRQQISGKEVYHGVYKTKMFCGASHFLRTDFYKEPPYLSNKYGYEELPPSLLAYDAGYITAFCPELVVIHNPKINKWDKSNSNNNEILFRECAIPYSIHKMMYPAVFHPICYFAYLSRIKKHLASVKSAKNECDKLVEENCEMYSIKKKIRFSTVIRLYKDFGLSIF